MTSKRGSQSDDAADDGLGGSVLNSEWYLRFYTTDASTTEEPDGPSSWVSGEKIGAHLSDFVHRSNQPAFRVVAGRSNWQERSLSLSDAHYGVLARDAGLALDQVSWFKDRGQYGRAEQHGPNGAVQSLSLWFHSPDSYVHEMSACARIDLGAGASAVLAYFDRSDGRIDRVLGQLPAFGRRRGAAVERRTVRMGGGSRSRPVEPCVTAGGAAFAALAALLDAHLRSTEQWRLLIDHRIRAMEGETGARSQQLEFEPERPHGFNLGRLIMGTQNQNMSLVSLEHVATWQLAVARFIVDAWAAYCDADTAPFAEPGDRPQIEAERQRVRLRLLNHVADCELCCSRVAGAQKRMQSQISILLGLISQRDSRINIQLAQESREISMAAKSDSKVMRVIATLGLVFLPATLVAAIFSTGIFNLQAQLDQDSRVSPLWWVYVLASCVSTAAVVIPGYLFLRLSVSTPPRLVS